MVIVSLDISVSNYLEDLLQGHDHLLQAASYLDTPIRGLGRTVGVYLHIRPTVLTNVLNLLPTLSNNSPHNGLVYEQPYLPVPTIILTLLLLVHERDGGLQHRGDNVWVRGHNTHHSFRPWTVRDPNLRLEFRSQFLDVLTSFPNN